MVPFSNTLVTDLLPLLALVTIVSANTNTQQPWSITNADETFTVKEWEAIGPFPIGMREHPFLASPPAYVSLDHSSPLSLDQQFLDLPFNTSTIDFPSYLVPRGQALWSRFDGDLGGVQGRVEVGYEDEVDWMSLRRDKGWEGVQFEVLLRGNITVPNGPPSSGTMGPELVDVEVQLLQGLEFSIHPHLQPNPRPSSTSKPPSNPDLINPDLTRWISGNIYSLSSPTPQDDSQWYLPQLVSLIPGSTYTILLRAMYEVRLFGDPSSRKGGPKIELDFRMRLDRGEMALSSRGEGGGSLSIVPGLNLIGDVLDGWVLGSAVGLGLKGMKVGSTVKVLDVKVNSPDLGVSFRIPKSGFRLVDKQTRLLSLEMDQKVAFPPSFTILELVVTYTHDESDTTSDLIVPLELRHQTWSSRTNQTSWKFIHSYPSSTLTYGMILPPTSPTPYPTSKTNLTFLALHGAGVHAGSRAWTDELPRLDNGWGVAVTGGNQWGMDWHGVSMEGSRLGLREAREVVRRLAGRMGWGDEGWWMADETVVMGHSNGGQGANHLVSHYPDEFIGLIQAAGYLKIQAYVSYNSWTSRHFIDPALLSILDAALTPFDNPLYASNLVGIPVLAIHGTEDDNVPVWHSRAMRGIMREWAGSSDLFELDEVPGEGHFWPGIMKRESVFDYISSARARHRDPLATGFTLTTANPAESGSKGGIRILELEVPGRLGRVTVSPLTSLEPDGNIVITTSNVARVSIDKVLMNGSATLVVDKQVVTTDHTNARVHAENRHGRWSISAQQMNVSVRSGGPMLRVLSSSGPLLLVYGTLRNHQRHKTMATALAHDIHLYQSLDVEIVDDITALDLARRQELGDRNVICLGHPHDNGFVSWLLETTSSPSGSTRDLPQKDGTQLIQVGTVSAPSASTFRLHETVFDNPGTGLIALLAHPDSNGHLICMIAGTNELGSSLAARTLAVRTGVPVPDWLVLDSSTRFRGVGGVVGAGFWNDDWKWSEAMSYMS